MKQNVGGLDRTARLVAGPALAALGLLILAEVVSASVSLGWVLLVAGAVVLATGVFQRCLLTRLLGIDTCRV